MSDSETTHDLGQYFTTNEQLKTKVLEFILNDPEIILEPSVGQGDLVQCILNNNANPDIKLIVDIYLTTTGSTSSSLILNLIQLIKHKDIPVKPSP